MERVEAEKAARSTGHDRRKKEEALEKWEIKHERRGLNRPKAGS